MATNMFFACSAMAFLLFLSIDSLFCSCDPTEGFSYLPLTEWNFKKQYPYNLRLRDRYSYRDGVRRFRLYSTDRSYHENIRTRPRTEIRVRDYDYSSGVWQFQGDFFVPSGTCATVMQIKAVGSAAPMMLYVDTHTRKLKFYSSNLMDSNFYDRWMRINVVHDADANMVTVFVDGARKLEVQGSGHDTFCFKFGVYAQSSSSSYMESRWRDVHILRL